MKIYLRQIAFKKEDGTVDKKSDYKKQIKGERKELNNISYKELFNSLSTNEKRYLKTMGIIFIVFCVLDGIFYRYLDFYLNFHDNIQYVFLLIFVLLGGWYFSLVKLEQRNKKTISLWFCIYSVICVGLCAIFLIFIFYSLKG